LEAAQLTDTADLIVDLTETGTTLRENHLKLLDDGVVLRSQACLIGNARLLLEDSTALRVTEAMLELFEARVHARGRVMLTAEVRAENIEEMQHTCDRINLRLHAPVSSDDVGILTSETTSEPGWYMISGVVNVGDSASELLAIVGALRDSGAGRINITPLTYHFAEQAVNVRALRERLKRLA
jgi:ATP phosphoribosyltransferase